MKTQKQANSNLLALGETIVDTISSTIQQSSPQNAQSAQFEESTPASSAPEDSAVQLGSRVFTSRQIMCFRALTNLAISLGLTLQDSWNILWITFQWVDYFLNGADDYSGYANNKDLRKVPEPQIGSQDALIIKNAKAKLLDSFSAYQSSSFEELVNVLTLLHNNKGRGTTLQPCPFNKSFFITQLVLILTAHPSLLLDNKAVWDHVIAYLTDMATDRSLSLIHI